MKGKYAIVDLGSNSVRMIIMQVNEDGSYRMIDQVKAMVRLSQGMGPEGLLKEAAIKRTIEALSLFNKLMKVHEADHTFLVATAAVRLAKNQQEFLLRVSSETGLEFRVITGEEEAFYAYLGVINTIYIENCLIIDIGGASTEIILVENRSLKEAISLPFGAVSLTETYLNGGKTATAAELKALEKFIKDKLKNVEWLQKSKGLPLVGLGGTIRTLAKIDRKKIGFPLSSLHNYQMDRNEVIDAYNQVINKDLNEIKKVAGITKDRADIIVGGLAPVKILIEYLKIEKLVISGNGVREGLFYEHYMKRAGEGLLVRDVMQHSIDNILSIYGPNQKHSQQVKKLSMALFEQMVELHGLTSAERRLLEAASQLHDIGNYVDYYNHHKHGFYLVLNSRINGLRNRELVMCAFIVAMHREVEFKENWKNYKMLIDKQDYDMILKLRVFLQIAEKLDRSESSTVKDINCQILEDDVIIKLISDGSPELEMAAAMQYAKEFKKTFNKALYIF